MFYINLDTPSYSLRYDMRQFVDPINDDFSDFITSYFVMNIPSLELEGSVTIQGEGGKPDLLSYRLYGSTQYWWLILVYNNLVSVDELAEGMTIRYPKANAIEKLYYQLSTKQVTSS